MFSHHFSRYYTHLLLALSNFLKYCTISCFQLWETRVVYGLPVYIVNTLDVFFSDTAPEERDKWAELPEEAT